VIDVRRHFHSVNRKLDIHIALCLRRLNKIGKMMEKAFDTVFGQYIPTSGFNSSRQIVLMRMKEPSNLLLQLDLGVRLTHGCGGPKEFPLGACG
jgi:hypothetical protein